LSIYIYIYCIGSKTELGSHIMKMEQTGQQIRAMLTAHAHYVEPPVGRNGRGHKSQARQVTRRLGKDRRRPRNKVGRHESLY
jgi:hypothetical protein